MPQQSQGPPDVAGFLRRRFLSARCSSPRRPDSDMPASDLGAREEAPSAIPTVRACQPLWKEVAFQPGPAQVVVQELGDQEAKYGSIMPHPARWLHMSPKIFLPGSHEFTSMRVNFSLWEEILKRECYHPRAVSSVGRAPRSQRGGRGFESLTVHEFRVAKGRLAQWKSACFTRKRSLVQSQQRPLINQSLRTGESATRWCPVPVLFPPQNSGPKFPPRLANAPVTDAHSAASCGYLCGRADAGRSLG